MIRRKLFKIFIFILCVIAVVLSINETQADLHKKRDRAGVIYWHGDVNQNKIALTFDDGPNEPYTSQVLDILKTFNIKATFFLIGKNVEIYPGTTKRIVKEGHTIGNHTYNHPDLRLKPESQIEYQIKKAEEAILNATSIKPYLFRPPYGVDNPRVLAVVEKAGYVTVKWSVSGFNGGNEIKSDKILKKVLKGTKNGSIVLLHDGNRLIKKAERSQIVKALPLIIESLQEESYQFVTVPQLLGLKNER